jgi:hypothetical protein
MVTLALDLGSQTGFALLRADGRIESGTERFNPRANEREGGRFLRFKHWLIEVKAKNPDLRRIVFERVVQGIPNQTYAAQVYGGFLAVALMFCEHHQLEYEGFNVATVKKRFTGAGNAKKPDMVKQCEALGFKPDTHDEADAIAILHVATDRCPPITATPKKRKDRA